MRKQKNDAEAKQGREREEQLMKMDGLSLQGEGMRGAPN